MPDWDATDIRGRNVKARLGISPFPDYSLIVPYWTHSLDKKWSWIPLKAQAPAIFWQTIGTSIAYRPLCVPYRDCAVLHDGPDNRCHRPDHHTPRHSSLRFRNGRVPPSPWNFPFVFPGFGHRARGLPQSGPQVPSNIQVPGR